MAVWRIQQRVPTAFKEARLTAHSSPAILVGLVAFSPSDPGGVVLGGGDSLEGSITTELKRADSGRRVLDTQSFMLRGTSYVVTYSEYNYGPVQLGQFGTITNLLGYTASLAVKK